MVRASGSTAAGDFMLFAGASVKGNGRRRCFIDIRVWFMFCAKKCTFDYHGSIFLICHRSGSDHDRKKKYEK